MMEYYTSFRIHQEGSAIWVISELGLVKQSKRHAFIHGNKNVAVGAQSQSGYILPVLKRICPRFVANEALRKEARC